jgi:hypothetical protein
MHGIPPRPFNYSSSRRATYHTLAAQSLRQLSCLDAHGGLCRSLQPAVGPQQPHLFTAFSWNAIWPHHTATHVRICPRPRLPERPQLLAALTPAVQDSGRRIPGAGSRSLIPRIIGFAMAEKTFSAYMHGFAAYYCVCFVVNGWFCVRPGAEVKC